MTFTYFYKTSDGVRHKAEISASSRESAFAALREEGIRPIRMYAKTPPPRSPLWRWAAAALAATLALAAAVWLARRPPRSPASAPAPAVSEGLAEPDDSRYTNLVAQVATFAAAQGEAFATMDVLALAHRPELATMDDFAPLYDEVDAARQTLEASRSQLKELFRTGYGEFARGETDLKRAVQLCYVKATESLDAYEARIDAEEYALMLLDDHRDKWGFRSGELKFDDPALADEFRALAAETDAAALKWRREIGE